MPGQTILISVAHSRVSPGVESQHSALQEYLVSLRASLSAWQSLAGEFQVALFDCGALRQSQYDDAKIAFVNAAKPRLAIEIHCNGSIHETANYSEVIHHRASALGREAATVIARTLYEGFQHGHHKTWRTRGARPNTIEQDQHLLFWTERTNVPAIIVEGLFLSNREQSDWLAQGGQETYGMLVAEGVRRWLKGASE